MNIFKKPAQITAPEVAYRWLREAITSLPWDEEAFLSESAVAEASGTSRTPVREALLRLEAEGLLRRAPHRGAYVPALTESDIDIMMEARRVIEDWAVRKVTETGYSTHKLEEILENQANSLSDNVSFIKHDMSFHKELVAAAGNPLLDNLYDSLRYKQLRMGVGAIIDSDGRSDHVLEEHEAIVKAIQLKNAEVAIKAVHTHLASTLSSLKKTNTQSGRAGI
ncbi:hypothetical protein BTW10_00315 [Chromohalobacter japonicus]|uniref:HTH gntR-type domain-containing protein n=1 Tax=Chromohalobacter japonicus TaxID=223900 RepID=A0A1Q8THU3_9GAMM|nr:GntR family transcriptional regulator [Chromohalobacter japonicus]OLO13257.1 hypothetical protein BTW10_00315 [Chromohalobacter japonicus]